MLLYRHLLTWVFKISRWESGCKCLLEVHVINTFLGNLSENNLCSLLLDMSNTPTRHQEIVLDSTLPSGQLQQRRISKILLCTSKYDERALKYLDNT